MNSYKHVALKTMVIIISSLQSFSQSDGISKKSDILGKILDATQNEVGYASIVLIKNDSTIVNSAISKMDGQFKIFNVKAGTYQLVIKHIEFETYTSESFEVFNGESKVIPIITLNPAKNTLDEVVITQKKALIEVKADKLIFNVASSPSASGTNGLDLLKMSPGISLDIDNSISLLGKGNVQVYLNGIQSRLSGNDLTTFLQSLTSDIIDSIEIISNPPAKYDAEGTGGIINIRMKKNVATGFNGSATSSFTKGIEYKYSNNVSLNFGSEKIKTNFDITQSYDNDLEFFLDDKQQNNSLLYLNSKENKIRKGYNLGFGMEAQVAQNHSLNFATRAIFNNNENTLNSITNIYQASPLEFLEILSSQSFLNGNSSNYIFNLNHLWNTSDTSTINTNISLGSYDTERNTLQPNTYFEPDGTTVRNTDDAAFDANTKIDLWSAKIDYDKEWDKVTFSTGFKYAHIITKNEFAFYDFENNAPVLDPTKSNDFNYTESVAAFYSNLNIKLNTAITLNAGLRVENTNSRGTLISDIDVDNKDVPRNYTDFFPNVGISFDNQKNHSLSLNIGRRITRPNYQDLNPFETPTSQLVVWKGNPFLKPNYIMNYQVSYAYNQKLIITTSYSKTKDFFSRIVEVLNENNTQIIPRNMQIANNYALSTSYPVTVNKFWDFIIFGNIAYQTFEGNVEGTVIDLKNTFWDYRIQNNLKLPHDILIDITFKQRSKWIWRGSSFIKGTEGLSFGIRKDFLDKTLQVRITGSDILRTESDYPYFLNYGGLDLKGVYSNDARRFGLGATYKFGNQKAKIKSKTNSALDDELNRIGN
jgi:outer membrane receptor protein involved in Fe transport